MRAPASPVLRLVQALVLALAAACGTADEASDVRRASAVLITLDTTNPGALDIYGSDRGLTPELAKLASESVVFDRARTVCPITLPSHASMLTGLYPPRHLVRDNGHLPLPDSAVTLAELARAEGFRTAAFVAAAVLAGHFGLDQGFEIYEAPDADSERGGVILELDAREITRRAVGWLDGREGVEPFFLWVHYFDAHWPYAPPARHLERATGPFREYLGEVAAIDESVGDLLARLRTEPDYEAMTIVVVADHGEGLLRHGEVAHSLLIYDSTVHVPLFVRHPEDHRAGERSDASASVVDVFATLVDGMGLPFDSSVDGLSLLAPEGLPPNRGVYFESYYGYMSFGWSPLIGWADSSGTYLHDAAPQLFEPDDVQQANDVFDPDDARVARARAALDRLSRAEPLVRGDDERQLVGSAAVLSELGYAAGGGADIEFPHPLEPTQLPAPRSRLPEFYRSLSAITAGDAGRAEEAITILREIAAGNPSNAFALGSLAHFLTKEGRPRESIVVLNGLLESGSDSPDLRRRLAEAHGALGNFEEAVDQARRAAAQRPSDPKIVELVERLTRLLESEREKQNEDDGSGE